MDDYQGLKNYLANLLDSISHDRKNHGAFYPKRWIVRYEIDPCTQCLVVYIRDTVKSSMGKQFKWAVYDIKECTKEDLKIFADLIVEEIREELSALGYE